MAEDRIQVSVVIPACNEEQVIGEVLAELTSLPEAGHWEILVVDDGSTDNTAELARGSGAHVLTHRQNRGYGAALKTGIRAAKGEFVVTLDADGQHRASDIPQLLADTSSHEMVVGDRGRQHKSPRWRGPGKWALYRLANLLSGHKIPDLNCGLRVFRRETIARYLHLCPEGFSFSTTSTLVMFNRGYAVSYVPISVRPRVGASRVTVRTGFATLMLLLRLVMLFDPLRLFVPAALFLWGAGGIWGLRYILEGRGLSVAALLLLLTGVHVFFVGLLAEHIAQARKEKWE